MPDGPAPSRPLVLTLALLALVALGGQATDPGADPVGEAEPTPTDQPQRVVIHVDRHTEVAGHVELEDDDVIVVRTTGGAVRSFAKPRVTRVVRLVEAGDGREGVVILRNGQLRRGLIIADDFEQVVLEIEGMRTRLKRAVVDHVELEPTVEERYAHFKSTLRPGMTRRHLALCQWLVEERRYELAEQELEELLSRDETPGARDLLRLVAAQLALERAPRIPAPSVEPETIEDAADAPPPTPLLSEEDVNLIRVYEIDFRQPPKLAVSRMTIEKLIARYGTSKLIPADERLRNRLYQADPIKVAELMFKLAARDLYGDIDVLSEPHALNLFRQRVHNTWLMNNCATSGCHGGDQAGRLVLHRRRFRDERVRYTNLLILERLVIDPQWPLINYESPADSLIIQYGLPRTLARMPHPAAEGWSPVFRSARDRMIQDSIRWIEAMFRPRPEYPVTLEMPLPAARERVGPPR